MADQARRRKVCQGLRVLPVGIDASTVVSLLCAALFICSMEQGDEGSDIPLLGVALGMNEAAR
ncbi:hypothetical protein [Actinomadura alba]|uniref:Uncharacterized protein n=1 Tax=Actinomadura alba TaxID=406431 RepID=A0ABR7LLY4_9ACTN|nr:hypothetical protein [Actinomadura alba]MBC6465871.1 hypothetical protein [Actinomadura alba]